MALIRIYVTLERQAPHGIEREEHASLTRETNNAGLISDLENFWRVVRTVASIRGWTPTLHVCSDDRSRCVALRDPPFAPSERAESEQARSIFDALCKLTDATRPARAPSQRAIVQASAEHASTAHPREHSARASQHPQASAEHASGTHPRARASEHPHASAEHESDAHPRERSAQASEHPQASAERESGAFPRVLPLSASTPPRNTRR